MNYSSEKAGYRPDVDGLRALAVLTVILCHAGLGCPGGFVGVDVFFVISGFLITSLLSREISEGQFSLVAFWERRIRRIFPTIFVVVLATLIAGWFLYLPEDFLTLGKSALAQTVLLANVFFFRKTGYFEDAADTHPLLHTWSLAVEEQFYLLFPLLLFFLTRCGRKSLVGGIAFLGVGSFALSVVGSYSHPAATFYLLPSRAWELMMGALLAVLPDGRKPTRWLNEAAGLAGLGLILFSVFTYTSLTRFPGVAALPPCLGAALIIFSGRSKITLVGRGLVWRPLVFIGLISYSLYLWHWPLLVFWKYSSGAAPLWQQSAAWLIVSFLLSVLSWKFIETPFRKRVLCPTRPQIFALAGFSALALLLLGGGIYLRRGMPSRLPAVARVYAAARNDRAFRNEISLPEAVAGQFAELGAQGTNQPVEILVWGDSHAMAVAPALDALCRRFSVRGLEATRSGMPPLLDYVTYSAYYTDKKDYPAIARSVLECIRQKRIKTVIMAAKWSLYGPVDSLSAKLATTVQAVLRAGARVYVLKDVPAPDFNVPRCAALTVMHHGDLAHLAIPEAFYRSRTIGYEPIFQRAAQWGATVLDSPRYFLNDQGLYDVVRGNKALYWDTDHLSVEGSKVLTPMFEPLFQENRNLSHNSPPG